EAANVYMASSWK
ncbi:unnamed protein product, partial [Diplocarpon coronariae]